VLADQIFYFASNMYQLLDDCDIMIISRLIRKVKNMFDYNEISEVRQDLELQSIDLEGAIERLSIEVENHSDLFEKEDLSEDAKSMMNRLVEAKELLSTIIGHFVAIESDK